MLRSEIESFRSPTVEFFRGTTLHFEITVTESQGEDGEDIFVCNKNECVLQTLVSVEKRTMGVPYLY